MKKFPNRKGQKIGSSTVLVLYFLLKFEILESSLLSLIKASLVFYLLVLTKR
jgi:hypothetical protein